MSVYLIIKSETSLVDKKQFENIKIAQKILKSKKLKLLIEKFDNKWDNKVNRTREIVDIIQEY